MTLKEARIRSHSLTGLGGKKRDRIDTRATPVLRSKEDNVLSKKG